MRFDRLKGRKRVEAGRNWLVLFVGATLLFAPAVYAKTGAGTASLTKRYIVQLQDPPLATYAGQKLSVPDRDGGERLYATSPRLTGDRKLKVGSPASTAYLKFVRERHKEFQHEVSLLLGRVIDPVHQYRLATNGMALDLEPAEAELLRQSPLVKSLIPDVAYRLDTFAGPKWIGAAEIWTGDSGFPETRGEGMVVGVLDSGINWDHPSFADPSIDGYFHNNPLGGYRGLCNDPGSGAQCNNKLIGVYDFVEDDPGTEFEEQNTNGKDIDSDGHGSHVASTAVGNPINTYLGDGINVNVSGVAPRANLVTYRVCYPEDPEDSNGSVCDSSDILAGIDQAISDGVDVINYSLGADSGAGDPWQPGSVPLALLNAREAGIFTAASAGNEGPDSETIGSPANAPWVISVGAATHNVGFGSVVENLQGGNTAPPEDLVGASLTDGIGQTTIVHAKDYGFPLCGVGDAELEASCEDNEGLSNPWDGQTPFNGEIVVCDRGIYGRVEKGKNVMLAGAGGYILANTEEAGEAIVADDHCLPATHIGETDGNELRAWLDSGSGHQGSISGYTQVESDGFADQVAVFSSRGPAQPPVTDTLKPNVIAPGVEIWAASNVGQAFRPLSGTSMASPHVAGAAALLKSVHPGWSVSQLASAIETTATAELATDQGVEAATTQQAGAGRPQLGEAANAGLYLDVSAAEFEEEDPGLGGKPRDLNLPALVDSGCVAECSFTRTVTDQMGGGNWTATPVGFPAGVDVSISPSSFNLVNGGSRTLNIEIDVSDSDILGEWVSGAIRLSASGSSDQFLTVTVFSKGGDLPESWSISDNRDGGWVVYNLSGLVPLDDATFTAGALTRPVQTVEKLAQDPTNDFPYDGTEGVYTVWHSLPQGGLWLHAKTLASTADDLDLFVGRDDNKNGIAEAAEELCSSTLEGDIEWCDLYDLPPGDYWILVQNWTATELDGDDATLVHAAIGPGTDSRFAVSGPGMTDANETIPVRMSWDNLDALPVEELLGAVGVGSVRGKPYNIGVIPLHFFRSGIAEAKTFPLLNGETHGLALAAKSQHDRLFIDVPPGASSLTVFADGASAEQSNALTLELKRLDFDAAMSEPPFATPAAGVPAIVTASGVGGNGPSISVFGVEPGRWYAVLSNTGSSASSVAIRAEVEFQGQDIEPRFGLWEPNSRPGLSQGYEFNQGGNSRALVWYTYDEAGQPTWYIANNAVTSGNIWTADLLRFTNDGMQQQSSPVGRVSIAILGETDAMFSYTLFGLSGSERMQPISSLTCPQVNGSRKSYTGLWYRGADGLGGASVLVNAQTQSQIHYLFDASGLPRWLYAQDLVNPEPTNSEVPILQFNGYCAVCQAAGISSQTVGVLERSFDSETQGSWSLDYLFQAPLTGSVDRMDPIVKLTDLLECL